ncbi:hypothetical protein VaNZ11_002475 [Volvox africanus]|uniref:F5/8 type C domain-containing protein n=1 Tax=Volvox africanus TaxID=51714 RepID=A0ABQ5RSR9_9CHLO|nr:hypothetical protein VaNZ11_002475 [Volvox africanus]
MATTMCSQVWFPLLVFLSIGFINSRAQIVGSLTWNASVLLSSNYDATTALAIRDGNDTTMWQSGACFPTSYITRVEMNALYWRCNVTSACTASSGSSNLYGATDGSMTTSGASIAFSTANSYAWFRVSLPVILNITRVGIRGVFASTASNTLFVEFASGDRLAVLYNATSWTFISSTGSWTGAVSLLVTSSAAFTITEMAAQYGACYENATVDMGSVQTIGSIRTRYWPGSTGVASWLLASTDGVKYTDVVSELMGQAPLDPTRLSALTLTLASPLQARFLAVRHKVVETDWAKVYVWGIDAFPPAPPPPPPSPSPPSPSPPSPSPPSPDPSGIPWDNFAGTIRAYSYQGAVNVSSNPDPKALPHLVDGNDNTQWQSDACLPTGYTSRPNMNPLLYLCGGNSSIGAPASYCTASTGSTKLATATDTDVYTGAVIAVDPNRVAGGVIDGAAFFSAIVPGGPRVISRVTYKGFSRENVSVVLVLQPAGGAAQRVVVATLVPDINNYAWTGVPGPWEDVVEVRLESTVSFTLTEVAVMSAPCVEWAVVDMGQIREVGVLRFRHWSPDAEHTNMSVSADGVNWTIMKSFMKPDQLDTTELYLPSVIYIRYMKITHKVKEDANWRKVYVWGIDAYDVYGRWGAPPAPAPHPLTLRGMMGVNGIWGWGFQDFSNRLHRVGKGPDYYTPVASWGRNYHSVNWDVKLPTRDPKYDTMSKTGTDGQWWLDWDKEYVGWKAAGLKVDASFQFTWDVFGPATWGPNVTDTAYKLGFKFGSHFGPGRAPPNVSLDAVEFGNEPWTGFNASTYAAMLRGFARGVKDADPTFRLLPCALQAGNPFAEDGDNGNFIGARIPPDVAPLLDVLNLHVYSWFRPPELNGTMIGVHPEHPGSTMNAVNNMMSWRTFNMPGKPVWVTEWGWDAHLPGEVCDTTLCVSQHAQALYGIRGLLVLARKGVQVADWFFYANADEGTTVFTRSGLRGSNSTNFPRLPVFDAFAAFMQLVGNQSFLGVAAERTDLYAYLVGPVNASTSAATHLVAWQPVAAGDGPDEPVVAASLSLARSPVAAWRVSGAGAVSVPLSSIVQVANSIQSGRTWTLQVSGVPLVIQLAV